MKNISEKSKSSPPKPKPPKDEEELKCQCGLVIRGHNNLHQHLVLEVGFETFSIFGKIRVFSIRPQQYTIVPNATRTQRD